MSNKERNKKHFSTLRGLYIQKERCLSTLEVINKQKKILQEKEDSILNKLKKLEAGINNINEHDFIFTTHFIERYKERVNEKHTIEEMKNYIVTSKFVHMVKTLGNGLYPTDDSKFVVVIEDNKFITIAVPDTKRKSRLRKLTRKRNEKNKYKDNRSDC